MPKVELSPDQLEAIARSHDEVSYYFPPQPPYPQLRTWRPYIRVCETDTQDASRARNLIPTNGVGGLNERQYAFVTAATSLNSDQTDLEHYDTSDIFKSLGVSRRGYLSTVRTVLERISSARYNLLTPLAARVMEELKEKSLFQNMYLQELAVVIARGYLTDEILDRYSIKTTSPTLPEEPRPVQLTSHPPSPILNQPDITPQPNRSQLENLETLSSAPTTEDGLISIPDHLLPNLMQLLKTTTLETVFDSIAEMEPGDVKKLIEEASNLADKARPKPQAVPVERRVKGMYTLPLRSYVQPDIPKRIQRSDQYYIPRGNSVEGELPQLDLPRPNTVDKPVPPPQRRERLNRPICPPGQRLSGDALIAEMEARRETLDSWENSAAYGRAGDYSMITPPMIRRRDGVIDIAHQMPCSSQFVTEGQPKPPITSPKRGRPSRAMLEERAKHYQDWGYTDSAINASESYLEE
jgi:hypothetical protein